MAVIVSPETICKARRSMAAIPASRPSVPVTTSTTGLDLEHFLPYRLSVLSNRISGAIAREYSQRFDLGVTEWRVMAVLGRYPDLSAGEVALRTAMDKVAVSRAVASLLDARRIERDIHDGDRRRSVLRLSAEGQRIYREVAPMALGFERNLLGDMAEAERTLLFRLLDRLDELELRAEADTPPP
jgi:DNA-binding MarR family transcriptional regulator